MCTCESAVFPALLLLLIALCCDVVCGLPYFTERHIGDPKYMDCFSMSEEHVVLSKFATFLTYQPDVGLALAEAQLNLRGITADDTNYYYVCRIGQGEVTPYTDLIIRLLDNNKYTTLKSWLEDPFGMDKWGRASTLLHFCTLGDSKSSFLMDGMLSPISEHKFCFLFEQLFLKRLPEDIHLQLVHTKFNDPREVAQRANTLWSSHNMTESFTAPALQIKDATQSKQTLLLSPLVWG